MWSISAVGLSKQIRAGPLCTKELQLSPTVLLITAFLWPWLEHITVRKMCSMSREKPLQLHDNCWKWHQKWVPSLKYSWRKKRAMWGQRQLHPYRTALLFLLLKEIKESSREAQGVWENFSPDFSAASVSHFKNFICRQFCMECRCLNPSLSEPLFSWPQLHNTFSHTEFLLQAFWDAVI